MKLFIIILVCLSLIVSCKEKKNTGEELTSADTIKESISDSLSIRNSITSFYNWYNKNYSKLMGYKLYSSINKKDAPPYKINWEEVGRYQQFVKDSVPYIGETFLANQKRFFEQCDSAFKVDVDDDIPYGFDYDWYTNSQEDPQYLVDDINKQHPWIIKINGDAARVEVAGSYDQQKAPSTILVVGMQKEKGEWKISRIGMD